MLNVLDLSDENHKEGIFLKSRLKDLGPDYSNFFILSKYLGNKGFNNRV